MLKLNEKKLEIIEKSIREHLLRMQTEPEYRKKCGEVDAEFVQHLIDVLESDEV